MVQPFSDRHGYSGIPPKISIREGVTDYIRHYAVVDVINRNTFTAHAARDIVCRIVRAVPDTVNNWSEGNVRQEVDDLVSRCDWWKVYDIIEAIYKHLEPQTVFPGCGIAAEDYEKLVNEMFVAEGIGKLSGGIIVARGDEDFEETIKVADTVLAEEKRETARDRLNEAFRDLSRRPKPDLAGAITHSVGALECVARDVTGDLKSTAGEILKKHPNMIPKPLDNSVALIWGYASNVARHVTEGQEISYEEAELVFGVSASVCTYLSRKFPSI